MLPPLGNDFVAMIKDSALVSALGVQDITQLGKVYSASTFLFFETYNVVAFLYLVMTLSLSLLVRGLEARLKRSGHRRLGRRCIPRAGLAHIHLPPPNRITACLKSSSTSPKGVRPRRRSALMKDITDAVVKNFEVNPEAVVVQIVEAPKADKMKGGLLFTERTPELPKT